MARTVQTLHQHNRRFRVRLGFVPLLDCAPLIVAHEIGFFRRAGIDVELVSEASWASLRDKVSFGLLDGAHMLAPMPAAMSLAVDRPALAVTGSMILTRNGNGITLTHQLSRELAEFGADPSSPTSSARALEALARRRGKPIQFASVAPWSCHDLQLRDWITMGGQTNSEAAQIIPIAPTQMSDAFRSGIIEGCCVGEPWNSLLESRHLGQLYHSGHQIWPDSPEKVLGMRQDWAEQQGTIHENLIACLVQANHWIQQPDNEPDLRHILAQPHYLGEAIRVLTEAGTPLFHPRIHQRFCIGADSRPDADSLGHITDRLAHWHQLAAVSRQSLESIYRPVGTGSSENAPSPDMASLHPNQAGPGENAPE